MRCDVEEKGKLAPIEEARGDGGQAEVSNNELPLDAKLSGTEIYGIKVSIEAVRHRDSGRGDG